MFLSMNDAVLSRYERSILSRVKTLEITRYVTKANKLDRQNERRNNADFFLSQFHTRIMEEIVLRVICWETWHGRSNCRSLWFS